MTYDRVATTRAANPLETFSDADLEIAERRAWYAAAREWHEYREAVRTGAYELAHMLQASAESGEAVWRLFNDERAKRGTARVGSPREINR